jgi:hypothetical protein
MNRRPNSETTYQPSVPLGHRVGLEVGSTVRVAGEYESVASKFDADSSRSQGTSLAVLSEQEYSLAVKHDAAIRIILGVFLPRQ